MNMQHVLRAGAAALSFAALIGFGLVRPVTAAGHDDDAYKMVTLIGCVQPEGDYYEGHWYGHEDYFVLANVTVVSAGEQLPPSITNESCATATPGAYIYKLTGQDDEFFGQFAGRRVVIVGELEDWDRFGFGAISGIWFRYHGELPKVEVGSLEEYVPPVAAVQP